MQINRFNINIYSQYVNKVFIAFLKIYKLLKDMSCQKFLFLMQLIIFVILRLLDGRYLCIILFLKNNQRNNFTERTVLFKFLITTGENENNVKNPTNSYEAKIRFPSGKGTVNW